MSDPVQPPALPVTGLPPGLAARPAARADGTLPRDRRGRVKVREAVIAADPPVSDATGLRWPDGIPADLQRWVLAATRRDWSTVARRLGQQALPTALDLAAAGIVELRTDFAGIQLGAPRRWDLTPAALRARARDQAGRQSMNEENSRRMAAAAAAVETIDPGLAGALRMSRPGTKTARLLTAAAQDLAAGIEHDGPRAFLQTHFGNTKTVADPAADLQRAGASPHSLAALGLTRSPYLGLAGPVEVQFERARWELAGLPGPTQIRLHVAAMPRVSLKSPARLVVVENLQAAEALSDSDPGVAVAWVPGLPSDPALRLVTALAEQASRCIIVPDADLGGLRIAERLLTADHRPDTVVVDVGAQPHTAGRPFGDTSVRGIQAYTRHPDPRLGGLAAACLERGYPVEQEAPTRGALAQVLG